MADEMQADQRVKTRAAKTLQKQSGPGRPLKSVTELLKEYGTAGTKLFAGVLSDEYLPELSFYQAPTTYDRMWRSDGTVSALVNAYMMPLRAAKWYVQPYDESPQALDQADFLHDNLWNFGTQTFDDFMREALSCLVYGFSIFEKIFDWIQVGDYVGKIGWHHFAYRHPQTRYRWNTEIVKTAGGATHRNLVSLTQFAPPDYRLVDIPVEKLLIFAVNKLGDNFDGISILRFAYTHWKVKQILYKIQGIGLERASIGVPYAGWLNNAPDSVIQYVTQMLENLRADDQASIQYDKNLVDIGFLQNHFDASGVAAAIEHHDTKIMQSGLAQFVNLGTRSSGVTGSYALSEDQSEMFLDALNGEANTFAGNFHMQATQQLIRLNFGADIPGMKMPKLAHGDIGQRSAIKLAQSLNAFAQYGFVSPDPRTENVLREFLDLPERDEDYHVVQAQSALNQSPFQSGSDQTPNAGPATPTPGQLTPQAGQPPQGKGRGPGTPGAAGNKKGVSGSGNGQRTGFRNKAISGAPVSARSTSGLSASERDTLYTTFMSELESLKRTATTWTPERPSTRYLRTRRPYVIRGDA